MEVNPCWGMSEHDLLVWFHNGKLVFLGVVTEGVLIPTPNEGEYVINVTLFKPHRPIVF